MPVDATEGVAEHSSRLQPSINFHAPVTAALHGTDVLPRRMLVQACVVIEVLWASSYIIGPTQDSNSGSRIQKHKR